MNLCLEKVIILCWDCYLDNLKMALSIFYQNVRGLRTKSNEFSLNLEAFDADITCITESWLTEGFLNSEYSSNRFHIHRRDRNYTSSNTSRGGGSIIIHKNNLRSTRIMEMESNINFVEDICLKVETESGSKSKVG